MSIEELVERGKTALREARMVVHCESGCYETVWKDNQGKQIAYGLGIPARCTNSPADRKLQCVHFDFVWRPLLNRTDYFIGDEDIVASARLEDWVNQQPLVAARCVSLGQYVTIGTWHVRRNRWMWGPKQDRH